MQILTGERLRSNLIASDEGVSGANRAGLLN